MKTVIHIVDSAGLPTLFGMKLYMEIYLKVTNLGYTITVELYTLYQYLLFITRVPEVTQENNMQCQSCLRIPNLRLNKLVYYIIILYVRTDSVSLFCSRICHTCHSVNKKNRIMSFQFILVLDHIITPHIFGAFFAKYIRAYISGPFVLLPSVGPLVSLCYLFYWSDC